MRWLLTFFFLALLGVVQALSSAGNRLLVVLEELKEKDKYSQLWADLECKLQRLTEAPIPRFQYMRVFNPSILTSFK